MALLDDLITQLRQDIGDTGDPQEYSDEDLARELSRALRLHTDRYSWATLPPVEGERVGILAWYFITMQQATKASKSALQYRTMDENSEVAIQMEEQAKNLLALADRLRREYQTEEVPLDELGTGDIVVGTLTRESRYQRSQVPYVGNLEPRPVTVYPVNEDSDEDFLPTSVTVRWSRPRDTDILFFRVLYRQSGATAWITATTIYKVDVTAFIIEDLVAETTYEIKVRTSDFNDLMVDSNVITVTTPAAS